MPISYKTLFLLEANAFSLIEIKLLDVQSDDPAKVYFWLQFHKASHTLDKLDFVAMHKDEYEQQREFQQGKLQFNQSNGTYTPTEAAEPISLKAQATTQLPAELNDAIQRYFVAG
ncbi:hypothetical protein HMJ29_14195 [Hymenobacter taeanensis]|uniref:Uncharacterized protein n=1 Tax=Hymenobacter taeanensis TaxID=2735321 RepID=A0A6M6BIT5_9BACT|nr:MULTISPECIES: hypothetical protein [Hymenobacter]QJX48026.1 hypothetical protein HMJ29_14195 [Hymenobacter taeanensis]UOQ82526.1 hypothetical protein MUN83_07110 [Hymenobacter sp. 5414T-23]